MKNNRIIARVLGIGLAALVGAVALLSAFSPSIHIKFGDGRAWAQSVSQGWGGLSSGNGSSYAITVPDFDAYRPSARLQFLANVANPGPATITVSWQGGALSSQNIFKLASGGPVALVAGDIQPGYTDLAYDGTEFILLSVQGTAVPGMIFDWSGPVPPAGFLLAGGQAVLRTTFNVLFNNTTVQQNGTLNSTTTVTGLASTANLNAGNPVCGPGIPAGDTVASIVSGSSITLSAAANENGTEPLVFAPNGCGDGQTTFNVIDLRSLAAVGKDDMNGTPANRLTTAGSGCNGVQIGAICGSQNQMIAQSGLPNQTIPIPAGQGSHMHSAPSGNIAASGAGLDVGGEPSVTMTEFPTTAAATLPAMVTASINGGVAQTPITTLSPVGVVYKIVKF
jgi:hypothetical protein